MCINIKIAALRCILSFWAIPQSPNFTCRIKFRSRGIQHLEHGESLKSRIAVLVVLKVLNVAALKTVPIPYKETFTSKFRDIKISTKVTTAYHRHLTGNDKFLLWKSDFNITLYVFNYIQMKTTNYLMIKVFWSDSVKSVNSYRSSRATSYLQLVNFKHNYLAEARIWTCFLKTVEFRKYHQTGSTL